MGEFKQHTLFKFKKHAFRYSFDTFRTPKGWDKAICNIIRVIGIWGFYFLMISHINIILFGVLVTPCLIMIGFIKVKFVQNKFKKFMW